MDTTVSDVAKQAANTILPDDNFVFIAIRESIRVTWYSTIWKNQLVCLLSYCYRYITKIDSFFYLQLTPWSPASQRLPPSSYSLLVTSMGNVVIVTPSFVNVGFFLVFGTIPRMLGVAPMLYIALGSDLVASSFTDELWQRATNVHSFPNLVSFKMSHCEMATHKILDIYCKTIPPLISIEFCWNGFRRNLQTSTTLSTNGERIKWRNVGMSKFNVLPVCSHR